MAKPNSVNAAENGRKRLGQIFQEARGHRSKAEVARGFDVTPDTIRNWETGKTVVRRGLRPAVAEFVGLNETEIWQMLGDEPPVAPVVPIRPGTAAAELSDAPDKRIVRYQELLFTGLEDGSAKDPRWSRAAEALAAQLGVPWSPAPSGGGATP